MRPRMPRRLAQGALVIAALALFLFSGRCDTPWFERHVFLPQQFFLRAGSGIAIAARILAAVTGALLLVLARSLRKRLSSPRVLLALLLAIPAAEVLLQWRMRRLVGTELRTAMDELTAVHPRYGVTLAGALDHSVRSSGRGILFRTDSEGRRFSGESIDPRQPSLVVTGESAAVGFGLKWEETFGALLAARLRLQAVNLASPAYRLDQSWLRLKDTLPQLEHPVAVIGIFMPGLIGRSFAGGQHPMARPSESGSIELRPQRTTLLRRSGLYRLWRHLYWSDGDLDQGLRSVAATLRSMTVLASARGIPCIFIVTGHTPPWMLHELFEAPALTYVVVDMPEDELLADGHPGPRGSLRIADAVGSRLRSASANR
jgi:hypothetical protein